MLWQLQVIDVSGSWGHFQYSGPHCTNMCWMGRSRHYSETAVQRLCDYQIVIDLGGFSSASQMLKCRISELRVKVY